MGEAAPLLHDALLGCEPLPPGPPRLLLLAIAAFLLTCWGGIAYLVMP